MRDPVSQRGGSRFPRLEVVMSDPRFTWGDSVRVKLSAPPAVRAGERGEVVAVTEIATPGMAEAHDLPLGSIVVHVEFGDGEDLAIPGAWLEAVKE